MKALYAMFFGLCLAYGAGVLAKPAKSVDIHGASVADNPSESTPHFLDGKYVVAKAIHMDNGVKSFVLMAGDGMFTSVTPELYARVNRGDHLYRWNTEWVR